MDKKVEKNLEIWADSFHEGVWCIENIKKYFRRNHFIINSSYLYGFIPFYEFEKEDIKINFIVYGSYKSWTPIPKKISKLIDWGKPDIIIYDAQNDNILLAIEETAAIPTGNQATQRCERQYGSARAKIPYWYLISEFGQHIDGGIRRDSIWPTIAALKLTLLNRTPCIVLHYSDKENVEDYSSGAGLELLFGSISKMIYNYVIEKDIFFEMQSFLQIQYQAMIDFVLSEWPRMIDFLPTEMVLKQKNTSMEITKYALNDNVNLQFQREFLVWPSFENLPDVVKENQAGKPLLKYDKLADLLERDISNGKAYNLSNNAGSGKPPKKEQLQSWIEEQRTLFENSPIVNPPISFHMKLEDFPRTDSGNYHITTAKNIIYLYDKWGDLLKSILTAYPRLESKLMDKYDLNQPAFLYLSNTIKPGRLFGDPFTGQLSAFSTIFGKFDEKPRLVIAYYPHQNFSQVLDSHGRFAKNKGMTLYTELTDLIIFNEGVAVSLRKGEIL